MVFRDCLKRVRMESMRVVQRITGIEPNRMFGLWWRLERERAEVGKPTGADDKSLPRSSSTFYAC